MLWPRPGKAGRGHNTCRFTIGARPGEGHPVASTANLPHPPCPGKPLLRLTRRARGAGGPHCQYCQCCQCCQCCRHRRPEAPRPARARCQDDGGEAPEESRRIRYSTTTTAIAITSAKATSIRLWAMQPCQSPSPDSSRESSEVRRSRIQVAWLPSKSLMVEAPPSVTSHVRATAKTAGPPTSRAVRKPVRRPESGRASRSRRRTSHGWKAAASISTPKAT